MTCRYPICWAVFFCLHLLFAALAAEKPVITARVRNVASMRGNTPLLDDPEFQGFGLARGSIFVIFGSGLGPEKLVLGATIVEKI